MGAAAAFQHANATLLPRHFCGVVGSAPTTLRAATDPTARGGRYDGPDGIGEARGDPKIVESSSRSHVADLQRALWDESVEMTGVDYPL